MLAPTVFHMPLKTSVEPVKWIPASSGLASAAFPIVEPEPNTRLMTPSGSPAACSTRIRKYAENAAVDAGFHTIVLPMSAGDDERLPPMHVKLNGLTATTDPSAGRYPRLFTVPVRS